MYILNIANTIKILTVNELRDLTFENYFKRIGFVKKRSFYSIKCLRRKDMLLLATKLTENNT